MNFNIDLQFILLASFGVTGVIQWIKGIVKKPKNPWSYISPIICIGMGLLTEGKLQDIIMNTVLILSISQLGYDVLVKPVKKLLGIPELHPKDVPPGTMKSMSPEESDIKEFLNSTNPG